MGGYIQCGSCNRIKHFNTWLEPPYTEQEIKILKRYKRIERLCPACQEKEEVVGDMPHLYP